MLMTLWGTTTNFEVSQDEVAVESNADHKTHNVGYDQPNSSCCLNQHDGAANENNRLTNHHEIHCAELGLGSCGMSK
jgi:hypothetical protein